MWYFLQYRPCVSYVYLSTHTQEVFLWLSLLIIIFPHIFLDELLWRMHLFCTLVVQMLTDVRGTRATKGFFCLFVYFVFIVVKCSSSHSWRKPLKAGGKSITSCLTAPSFSVVLLKHLRGAQNVAEVGPAGVCVQVSGGELLQHHQKNQMHFCVTSN